MKLPIVAAVLLLAAPQAGLTGEPPVEQPTGRADNVAGAEPEQAPASRWQLGFAFGYGVRTNPLRQSDDIPIVVDIDIGWFGDRFFFDNGDFGFTFADNERVTASLVARVNSDRVFFGNTETRFVTVSTVSPDTGMPVQLAVEFEVPDRSYATEIGVEFLADGSWGQLQMTAHRDISGRHDGYELYADYAFGWRNQRWYFEPSVGLSYKSDALNDYYWGVRESEANPALPAYTAAAGINPHARLALAYQVDRNWTFSVVGEYERLNSNAAESPIVDNKTIFGYFAGFGFRF